MTTLPSLSGVEAGTLVADTYQVVRVLGRGGMGAVWEAHHRRLPGKRVAIKVLHPSIAEDPESLARFRREAEIACRLGHPNIVEVHDFNKLESGSPYLILELLEGQSLDERLREGTVSLEEAQAIVRQVSSALQCAHDQDVIHRDLKPQNVFLVPSPTGEGGPIVKVLDFGISKIRGSQTVKTQDSTLLGTPQYMAPEQAVGNHAAVDARTDLFALATMLYEMLSGQAAFGGQSIPEVVYKVVHVEPEPIASLVPALSEAQAAAIHKAMAKAPEDRFESVAIFSENFSGVPLHRPRSASWPVKGPKAEAGELGSAQTVDSSKMMLAEAHTLDSQSRAALGIGAGFGSMETIDSQKLAAGVAETIDSSKFDKQAAHVAMPAAGSANTASKANVLTAQTTTPKSPLPSPSEQVLTDKDVASPRLPIAIESPSDGEATLGRVEDVQIASVASQALPVSPAEGKRIRYVISMVVTAACALALILYFKPGPEPDPAAGRLVEGSVPETSSAKASGGETSQTSPVEETEETLVAVDENNSDNDATETAVVPGTAANSGKGNSGEGNSGKGDRTEETASAGKKVQVPHPRPATWDKAADSNDEAELPADARSALAEAKAALDAGDANRAIRLAEQANRVKLSKRGFALQAMAYCVNRDLTNLRASMRKVKGRPAKRVRRFCQGVGFPVPR